MLRFLQGPPLQSAHGAPVPPGVDPFEERGGAAERALRIVRGQLESVDDPDHLRNAPPATLQSESPQAERVAHDQVGAGPDPPAGGLGQAGSLHDGARAAEGDIDQGRENSLGKFRPGQAGRMEDPYLVAPGREAGRQRPRRGGGIVGVPGARTDGHEVDRTSRHASDSPGGRKKRYVPVAD